MVGGKSKILVIVDIDETLVYATKEKLDINHDFMLDDYFVYQRPHYQDFMNYLENNFPFAVWSSATDTYVREISGTLGLLDKALFCWGRSKATLKKSLPIDSDGNLDIDAMNHHYFIKRLKKVKKFGFALEQVLIIDDSPSKLQENYGNAIYVSGFYGDQEDNELLLLIEYLNTLKNAENVRKIEKRQWKENMVKHKPNQTHRS